MEKQGAFNRQEAYQSEAERWGALFEEVDEGTRISAAGLIQKAAFLHALCAELEQVLSVSGPIKVHPQHPDVQKQVPAVKEYARLGEAYANVVGRINKLRAQSASDEDAGLSEYE